ncbi:hypothetical protein ABIF78_007750 [Bradyrhizobium japonicum]
MGRKKLWTEDMQSRFAEGTFAQIESLLENGESRTDFIRTAVDRELLRRKELNKKRRSKIKPSNAGRQNS